MKLVNEILSGNVLAAARLMRGIEDELPDAVNELKHIYLYTGQAHIVGVAGAPGAGKSTLLDSLINVSRKKKLTVGVLLLIRPVLLPAGQY